MNKASEGNEIPVELFQILEDDGMKVFHSIVQQIWKLSSDHRNGKGQFSFQLSIINCTHLTHQQVQFSSVAQSRQTLQDPCITARQASLSITNSWSSLKHMSIELVMPSSHLILCHPLFLLPPIPHSIRVFSNDSTLHMRWPKYWSFSFSISPSNEYPGLISFRMDWLDLLAVQGTLKSLLQYHSSKASFFGAQLSLQTNSHIHTDHWKTHSLDQMDMSLSELRELVMDREAWRAAIHGVPKSQT